MKQKIKYISTFAIYFSLVAPFYAYAGQLDPTNGSNETDPQKGILTIAATILTAGQYIGVGLITWGFVKFGIYVQEGRDDAQKRNTATTFIMGGVALLAIKEILKDIGVIASYT